MMDFNDARGGRYGDFGGPEAGRTPAIGPGQPTTFNQPGSGILPGIPQPVPGGAQGPSAPGAGPMPIPGFGGSQDLMRQIMMSILLPQLQRFFGGQAGWGPVAGSQGQAPINPYPAGMEMPGAPGAPGMRQLQPLPNPVQMGQGPAGMGQGMMSWLAPFIFQNFFQNMGGLGGGGGLNTSPSNPQPGMRYLM